MPNTFDNVATLSPEALAVPPSRCLTSNAFIASSRGLYFFVASALTTNSPLESIAGIESDLADPGPATGPPEAKVSPGPIGLGGLES